MSVATASAQSNGKYSRKVKAGYGESLDVLYIGGWVFSLQHARRG